MVRVEGRTRADSGPHTQAMPQVENAGGERVAAEQPDATDPLLWTKAGELFARWQDGDSESLDQLVRLLTPVLWHVVRAYGLNKDAAEDVVQSTWLTLVRSGASITDPQAVGKWLTITARRQAWRSRSRRQPDPVEDSCLEWHLESEPSAESHVVQGIGERHLWAAVQRLPERCIRLLRVIAFSDKPNYASLAAELGMPIGSIGPTRGRCLQRLKALITTQGVQHD